MDGFSVLKLGEYSWHRVEINGSQAAFVGWILAAVFVFLLFLLAVHALLGMAAYHDAQARGNAEPLLWGLLVGFFGVVPGIVYLCLRGASRPMVCCPGCGLWHRSGEAFCPRCGCPAPAAPQQQGNPYAGELERKARAELIAAAVCFAVGLMLMIAAAFVLASAAVRYGVTVAVH